MLTKDGEGVLSRLLVLVDPYYRSGWHRDRVGQNDG